MLHLHPLYDPWREFRAAVRQMDDIFRGVEPSGSANPAFEVHENDDAFVIESALPGVEENDLTIEATSNTVTIKGSRAITAPEGYKTHRSERRDIEFARTFRFPHKLDLDHVQARFDHGVLRLEVAKAAEARPRRIVLERAAAQPSLTANVTHAAAQ